MVLAPSFSANPMDLNALLRTLVEKQASDLFLTAGARIHLKIEGKLVAFGESALPAGAVGRILQAITTPAQQQEFEQELELNFAHVVQDLGRFRVNAFRQRGEPALVIRAIRSDIPSLQQLQLPSVLEHVIMSPRGLVLMVGATGSGKSTSLASMIDYRNRNATGHILTIEDPIEFVHHHQQSLVNQREVGMDTLHFKRALKNAMREAPDVILIGEILDAETMEAAIAFSETGHLCLATLHANNADQAIERILNFFPDAAHNNVLTNLSLNVRAIISQRLVPGVDNRRLPAVEVMLQTPHLRDLIRQNRIHEIKQAMEDSLEQGMETFDQALYRLFKEGRITKAAALDAADSRDGLDLKFRMSEGSNQPHDPFAVDYGQGS